MAEQVLPMADIAVEPGPVLQAQVHAVALVVQVVQGHHVLQVVLLEVLIAEMQQPVNPVWPEDPAQQAMQEQRARPERLPFPAFLFRVVQEEQVPQALLAAEEVEAVEAVADKTVAPMMLAEAVEAEAVVASEVQEVLVAQAVEDLLQCFYITTEQVAALSIVHLIPV